MDVIVRHQNRVFLTGDINKCAIRMFISLMDNPFDLLHQTIRSHKHNLMPNVRIHPKPEKRKLWPGFIHILDNRNDNLLVLIPDFPRAIHKQLISQLEQLTQ